jgi:hypothetical protein
MTFPQRSETKQRSQVGRFKAVQRQVEMFRRRPSPDPLMPGRNNKTTWHSM